MRVLESAADHATGGKQEYILEMNNITKYYNQVHALDGVDFKLARGQTLCLCGENGAGKSTLIKILSGAEHPTRGEIVLNGKRVTIANPAHAHELGISTVYQELIQIPQMSIAENIFLGRFRRKVGFVDFNDANIRAAELMEELGIQFDPRRKIGTLSTAQRQLVEILKAISYNSEIIIFDEPTSSLTIEESEFLFKTMARLKERGVSIIYISHRLAEIFRIGDAVMVLRDGKSMGTRHVADISENTLISMMVGRSLENQFPKEYAPIGECVLRAENINNQKVKNCTFELHKGEVLGFGGLVGAGRTELLRAVFGVDKAEGTVYLKGEKIRNDSPSKAIANGLALVPEDRKDQGLVLKLSVKKNVELSNLHNLAYAGFVKDAEACKLTQAYVDKLRIRIPTMHQLAANLSGGNQQKVVLARCLETRSEVLILDEPTRGIDVSAKVEIYQIINELAKQGVAIIMISSELPELLAMSDRIIVMNEGKITGELIHDEATEERILKLATLEK